uniref:Transportin-3 (Trinotate prediction) n=1 Tax=Myxobolus squamalis TaxID=59785 RepID=A0A6B2FWV6_MYXSQ
MQLNFANNLIKTNGYSKNLEVYAPIDMIGSIFKFLIIPKETDRAPFQSLINQILIFAVEFLDISRYSDDLCEKICRLLRYIIKFMGPSYCLRREISKKAIEWFIVSGRSSFMYLMCTIVDLYSKDIVNQEWILHDFLLFGQPAILSLNQDIASPEFPYLLEDYIRLCIKIYQFVPVSFLSSEICKPVILTTIKGLLCENKKSFNACSSFLSMIFKEKFYERDIDRLVVKDSVATIFIEFSHVIIKYCLQNIFSHKSLFIIELSGELLVVLLKYNQVILSPIHLHN